MSRRTVQLKDRTVIISPEEPVALANRIQAILKLRITDELTSKPPLSNIDLRVEEKGYTTRVASDGLAGLVGIPFRVIPRLDLKDYPVNLTVSAEGYLTRELHELILQDPAFPGHFEPRKIDLPLHRQPVTIFGRTIRKADRTPLPGAEVRLSGVWRTPADITTVPADPPNIVHLQPPLYLDRQALTQPLQPRDLPVPAVPDKTLVANVAFGTDAIEITDRQGLAAGDVVQIDGDQPDLVEFVELKTVPTTSPADQPTLITLNQKLMHGHLRGVAVKRATPQPPGVPRSLVVDAISGDGCIFVANLAGLVSGHEVQISGLAGKDEYHRVTTFSVLSDSEGYYRLPPLSRVAQIEIHAEKIIGAQTFTVTTAHSPDYRLRENRLDLTLDA